MSLWQRLFGAKNKETKAPEAPQMRSIFAGAKVGRLTMDWVAGSMSADRELQSGNLLLVRARARELARNNPVVRSYMGLRAANVVGPDGIRAQAQLFNEDGSLAQEECRALEAAFNDWAKSVSVCGRLSLTDSAQLADNTSAVDGEVMVQLLNLPLTHNKYGFGIRIIDADLLDLEYNRAAGKGPRGEVVNEVRMGVELDAYGKPVAYHVWNAHPYDYNQTVRERLRIPASELLHLYEATRPGQTRGVSALNSVMVPLKMLEGYQEAELVSARISSAKLGWLKYTEAAAAELSHEIPQNPLHYTAEAGSIQMLPPGLEFQSWDPGSPTGTYDPFVKSKLREVAAGLKVSYNSLAADLSGVNYSSLRSGLLLERDQWRTLQRRIIDKLYQPLFEAFVRNAVLTPEWPAELTRDAERYTKCVRWIARGWDWVDPLKDINAQVVALQNGLTSRDEILAEKGGNFEDVLNQVKREQQMLAEAGVVFKNEAVSAADQAALAALDAQE